MEFWRGTKPAGLRTYMLVSVGAGLFALIPMLVASSDAAAATKNVSSRIWDPGEAHANFRDPQVCPEPLSRGEVRCGAGYGVNERRWQEP